MLTGWLDGEPGFSCPTGLIHGKHKSRVINGLCALHAGFLFLYRVQESKPKVSRGGTLDPWSSTSAIGTAHRL